MKSAALTILGVAAVSALPAQATTLATGVPLADLGTPQRLIVAGDPNGNPPDSPAQRVDPNTTTSPFAGVGSIFSDVPGDGGFLGTGSAISKRHILTAAHLFDVDDDGLADVAPSDVFFILNFGSDFSHIVQPQAVSIHPSYIGFSNSPFDDLAILTLGEDLPAGLPIYSLLQPGNTVIQPLVLAGYGTTGDGVNGYDLTTASFEVKRAGANILEYGEFDDDGSGNVEIFAYDFEDSANVAGTDVFGLPTSLGNDIESMVGPGDSGGPAFALDFGSGELLLAGVNTFVVAGPNGHGTFGSIGAGIWLEGYFPWLQQTTGINFGVPDGGSSLAMGAVAFVLLAGLKRRS